MVEQTADDPLTVGRRSELRLVAPVGRLQNVVEPRRIRLLDLVARAVEGVAKIVRGGGERYPSCVGRHEELMLIRVPLGNFWGHPGRHGPLYLLLEPI